MIIGAEGNASSGYTTLIADPTFPFVKSEVGSDLLFQNMTLKQPVQTAAEGTPATTNGTISAAGTIVLHGSNGTTTTTGTFATLTLDIIQGAIGLVGATCERVGHQVAQGGGLLGKLSAIAGDQAAAVGEGAGSAVAYGDRAAAGAGGDGALVDQGLAGIVGKSRLQRSEVSGSSSRPCRIGPMMWCGATQSYVDGPKTSTQSSGRIRSFWKSRGLVSLR